MEQKKAEVIVVDNGSIDGTPEMIRSEFPNVILIAEQKNHGFAKGNNIAAARARGTYLLILNPDTRVLEGAIDAMLRVLELHPDVGVVGPHLTNPNGSHQDSVRRFPTVFSHALVLLKLSHILSHTAVLQRYYATDVDYAREQEVDQVMGAAMMMRRSVFEELHGFDEEYWIWMEEVDLQKRLQNMGLKIYYTPTATLVHYGARSFTQTSLLSRAWRFANSSAYYFRKHHSIVAFGFIWIVSRVHIILTWMYARVRRAM